MERLDLHLQLRQVLAMLQVLEQVSLRTLLAMRERLEDAVLFEQPRDLAQAFIQTSFGAQGIHDIGVTRVSVSSPRICKRRAGPLISA
jgi:hypothetical protein